MKDPIDSDQGIKHTLPIDPDEQIDEPLDHAHHLRGELDVLCVIALGGFLGTLARYEVGRAWTQPATSFPLTIFVVNVSGAFLIGVLLTAIIEIWRPSRLLRPLLCVGVLGGWTTMSALAVESDHLISTGHLAIVALYLVASATIGPLASALGICLTQALSRSAQPSPRRSPT